MFPATLRNLGGESSLELGIYRAPELAPGYTEFLLQLRNRLVVDPFLVSLKGNVRQLLVHRLSPFDSPRGERPCGRKARRQIVQSENVLQLLVVQPRAPLVEEEVAELSVAEKERIVGVSPPRRGAAHVPMRCGHQVRVFIADVNNPLPESLWRRHVWCQRFGHRQLSGLTLSPPKWSCSARLWHSGLQDDTIDPVAEPIEAGINAQDRMSR